MSRSTSPDERHRFPPAIIRYAIWLYHRFNLSHRDIEDLLAERGIEASYESVRLWCHKFDPLFSKRLKRRHPGFGDTFFIDEVFVTIAGRRHDLWRAVDQDGDVVDVYLQARRNAQSFHDEKTGTHWTFDGSTFWSFDDPLSASWKADYAQLSWTARHDALGTVRRRSGGLAAGWHEQSALE